MKTLIWIFLFGFSQSVFAEVFYECVQDDFTITGQFNDMGGGVLIKKSGVEVFRDSLAVSGLGHDAVRAGYRVRFTDIHGNYMAFFMLGTRELETPRFCSGVGDFRIETATGKFETLSADCAFTVRP